MKIYYLKEDPDFFEVGPGQKIPISELIATDNIPEKVYCPTCGSYVDEKDVRER